MAQSSSAVSGLLMVEKSATSRAPRAAAGDDRQQDGDWICLPEVTQPADVLLSYEQAALSLPQWRCTRLHP